MMIEPAATVSQGTTSPAAHFPAGFGDTLFSRLRRNCSISTVVPTAETVAILLAVPSPSGPSTTSFAKPPPVSGNPPRPTAINAVGKSIGHRFLLPVAAITPTERNRAPL